MDAHTRFQTQIVGALPVITHYLERIDLAATIDQLVPREGDVPLGTLVEVLITNRLLQPKVLFRVGLWAQAAAVTDFRLEKPRRILYSFGNALWPVHRARGS